MKFSWSVFPKRVDCLSFFLLTCTLATNPLSGVCNTKLFILSCVSLSLVSFDEQKSLTWMKPNLPMSSFLAHVCGLCSTSLVSPALRRLSLEASFFSFSHSGLLSTWRWLLFAGWEGRPGVQAGSSCCPEVGVLRWVLVNQGTPGRGSVPGFSLHGHHTALPHQHFT